MLTRRALLLTPLALAAQQLNRKVLLIVVPQWRGMAVPWNKDPDLIAPNLEKLAGESVVFTRAYATYPATGAGRAALLTGRYPHATPGKAVLEAVSPQVQSWKPYDPDQIHIRENVLSSDEPKARKDLADRYGYYTAADREIGKLVSAASPDTVIVFTAESGEQIGSQSLDGDDVAYEESVRIPLAIRVPGVRPVVSDMLISQVDIAPTLLGMSDEFQGVDLSSLLKGQGGERPQSIYSEGKFKQKDEWRMLVLGFDKLVVNGQTEVTHLFNLADDPYELSNLARDPGLLLKRDGLLAALRTSMRKLNDFKRR